MSIWIIDRDCFRTNNDGSFDIDTATVLIPTTTVATTANGPTTTPKATTAKGPTVYVHSLSMSYRYIVIQLQVHSLLLSNGEGFAIASAPFWLVLRLIMLMLILMLVLLPTTPVTTVSTGPTVYVHSLTMSRLENFAIAFATSFCQPSNMHWMILLEIIMIMLRLPWCSCVMILMLKLLLLLRRLLFFTTFDDAIALILLLPITPVATIANGPTVYVPLPSWTLLLLRRLRSSAYNLTIAGTNAITDADTFRVHHFILFLVIISNSNSK